MCIAALFGMGSGPAIVKAASMFEKENNDEETYYCDCTNKDCGLIFHIMYLDDKCPKCGSDVEPSDCDGGW